MTNSIGGAKECNGWIFYEWDEAYEMEAVRRKALLNRKNTDSCILYEDAIKLSKFFPIHDNGSRSFKVIVDKDGITVYKFNSKKYWEDYNAGTIETDNTTDHAYHHEHLKSDLTYGDHPNDLGSNKYYSYAFNIPKFIRYWYGFDTTYNYFHGNSLLVNTKNNRCMCITSSIYEIAINETIIDYMSPIGNNDVPCPLIYGEKNI